MLQLPDQEQSYWRQDYPGSLYPQLHDDLKVDVVVVGAGITGLTSAYLLKRAGLKVAVIEKSTVGGGTTGRTTGKVTSQHNLIYHDLLQRLGDKTARLYGEANQAALAQIQTIINAQKISCGWQRTDNYVYTTNPEQIQQFKTEAQIAVSLGLPASFATNTPLPFAVQAAVKSSEQGQLNPPEYLLGLAQAVSGWVLVGHGQET